MTYANPRGMTMARMASNGSKILFILGGVLLQHVMTGGKDNSSGMRDSSNGRNNTAIVTIIRRHFEANMRFHLSGRLLTVAFLHVDGTQAL